MKDHSDHPAESQSGANSQPASDAADFLTADFTEQDRILARFHDGEATPAERSAVERIVETTPAAREQLGWMAMLGRGLRRGLPSGGLPGSPPGLAERIMVRIRQMGAEQHPLVSLLPHMRRIAIAAAVLIAVGALVIFVRRPRGATPHDPVASEVPGAPVPGAPGGFGEERLVSRPDPLRGSRTTTRFYEPRLIALYKLNGPRGERGPSKDGSDR